MSRRQLKSPTKSFSGWDQGEAGTTATSSPAPIQEEQQPQKQKLPPVNPTVAKILSGELRLVRLSEIPIGKEFFSDGETWIRTGLEEIEDAITGDRFKYSMKNWVCPL